MARFLIVDDDPITVGGMASLLADDGHTVSPFTSGGEAVAALLRESFDAVLTDLEMPHVDGHAVVRATREKQPAACLVVLSARAEENEKLLTEAGVCSVTAKPVDFSQITKAVNECRARGGPEHGRCHMRQRTASDIKKPR